MSDEVAYETTDEDGVVTQERVSVNETYLYLKLRQLVRVDGVERATHLKKLVVRCTVDSSQLWLTALVFFV